MITTNLVVALMIVSSQLEPVQAVSIETKASKDGWYSTQQNPVETLYRKKNVTNFVYSTTINTNRLKSKCSFGGCEKMHTYEPGELLGYDVKEFFCYAPDSFCSDHQWIKYLR